MLISTYLPIGVSNISYVSLGRLSSVSGDFRQSRENFVSLGRKSGEDQATERRNRARASKIKRQGHRARSNRRSSFCYGSCASSQGSLDWFEVQGGEDS